MIQLELLSGYLFLLLLFLYSVNGQTTLLRNPVSFMVYVTTATPASQASFMVYVSTATPAPQVIQTAPATCQFATYENRNSPGGIFKGIQSLANCQNICMMANNCLYGFDISILNNECWVSTRPFDLLNPVMAGVNHYDCNIYNPPPTLAPQTIAPIAPQNIWSSMSNTNTPGGRFDPATTLDNCKAHCIAAGGCPYGFDWVESTTATARCYISTSKQYGVLNGVSHYSLSPSNGPLNNSAYRNRLFISGTVMMLSMVQMLI